MQGQLQDHVQGLRPTAGGGSQVARQFCLLRWALSVLAADYPLSFAVDGRGLEDPSGRRHDPSARLDRQVGESSPPRRVSASRVEADETWE